MALLPGSRQFFDLKDRQWQRRRQTDSFSVNSLEFDVFNIGVSQRSSNAKDAFDFAVWLVEKRISGNLLRGLTGPLRAAHMGRIDRWLNLEDVDRDFQDELTGWQTGMHEEKVVFMFPQILRRSEYLNALDESVGKFLTGEGDPQQVLEKVCQRWDELSKEIGVDAQVKELSRTSGL